MKRRGFSVALVGADGAGKTTLGRRLERELPLPARYLYMGVNSESSNRVLPTTRGLRAIRRARGIEVDGGPPEPARAKERPAGRTRGGAATVKSWLALANLLAEELYRHALASRLQRRGLVVLFDRHFFADYYAHDVTGGGLPLDRRVHGLVLARLYAKPDLVLFLDAPVQVLKQRKGEGTLEALERRRQEYCALAGVMPHYAVLDAGRPADAVAHDAIELVEEFAATGTVLSRALPPNGNGRWPGSS